MPPEKKKSGQPLLLRALERQHRPAPGQRRGSVLVLDQLEHIDGVPGIVDLVEYFFSGEKPVERLTHGQGYLRVLSEYSRSRAMRMSLRSRVIAEHP